MRKFPGGVCNFLLAALFFVATAKSIQQTPCPEESRDFSLAALGCFDDLLFVICALCDPMNPTFMAHGAWGGLVVLSRKVFCACLGRELLL